MSQASLTVDQPAKLFINAALNMLLASSGAIVDCYVSVDGVYDLNTYAARWIPKTVGEMTSLAILKTATVPSGQHSVAVVCENAYSGTAYPYRSNLTVLAVPS
jgi:hypothetical protein